MTRRSEKIEKSSTGRWLVILCEEDKSYSLVQEKSVICEPSVKVGDRVSFFFGRKTPFDGIVAAIDSNYNEMKEKQDLLNATNKAKPPSFHEDRPRRTKQKCQQALKSLCGSKHQSSKIEVKAPPIKKSSASTSNTNMECKSKPSVEGHYVQHSKFVGSQKEGNGDNVVSVAHQSKDLKRANIVKSSTRSSKRSKKVPNPLEDTSSDSEESLKGISENDVTDQEDSNKSSEEDLTPEELALLKKIAQKRRASEVQQLMDFAMQSKIVSNPSLNTSAKDIIDVDDIISDSSEGNFTGDGTTEPVSHGNGMKKDQVVTDALETQPESSGKSVEPYKSAPTTSVRVSEPTGKSAALVSASPSNLPSSKANSNFAEAPRKRQGKYKPNYEKKVFNGEYFRHKTEDPEVVKLYSNFEVYVLSSDISEVKKNAKSGTECARLLLPKVFTEEAIRECSVKGRPASGLGRDKAVLRPPLAPDGVEAIYAFCKARAAKKGWLDPKKSSINQAIGDVLNGRRYYANLNAAATTLLDNTSTSSETI